MVQYRIQLSANRGAIGVVDLHLSDSRTGTGY